ncbi:MAG: DUF2797 domain-containing protein [Flavobacteriales bacterium AspAUS03]
MKSEYTKPMQYYLNLQDDFLYMNPIIRKKIRLIHLHYECIHCRYDTPIYRQGYCKKCFFTLPQINPSVLRPELSTAHLNIKQRDLEWEKSFELQPHIVYLAITGSLKIGVTREIQIPTRWIDQGAIQAIKIARTPNRYLAGIVEEALKEKVSDKTDYRAMIRKKIPDTDLLAMKYHLKEFFPQETQDHFIQEDDITHLHYPVENYPDKIQILHLKEIKDFEKKLMGIKGQYWIFEDGSVINIRNHEGFYIETHIHND